VPIRERDRNGGSKPSRANTDFRLSFCLNTLGLVYIYIYIYIYILEPVSVGSWKIIQMRRITRSSTCVCLRLHNYIFVLSATRDMCSPHTRTSRSQQLRRPIPSLYSRNPRSRGLAVLPRLRAARAARTPTPITCTHCPNRFLYQFGVQSVKPFGRQCWMCVCTNLGPDRPGHLAAYAGCVMLRARLRAQRAHQCALATAHPHIFCPLLQ
jgi:hypothetical protein